MNGNWLTKTKKAYVYRNRKSLAYGRIVTAPALWVFDEGWYLVMLHGDAGTESFWYPTWDLAIRAIADLWRH